MGGENGYLDSPLSVAVKITETNPNQLPLPEEAITTEGKPYELVAPSGFQMGVAKEDTNQDKIDEVYYNVTFTTTIYTLKISAVDTKGALLEGFPRVIENGQRIPEVTYNGTFYFYLQAQGGAYHGFHDLLGSQRAIVDNAFFADGEARHQVDLHTVFLEFHEGLRRIFGVRMRGLNRRDHLQNSHGF